MTNIQKAIELINTFATGDTEKAASLLAEGYIQHNLAYGTGLDAFVGSVAYLASAPGKTTVNTIRSFADGDKVFLQTIYNFAGAGEQVAFDIFRFDDSGKIAEHWDNLAALAAQTHTFFFLKAQQRQLKRKQRVQMQQHHMIRQAFLIQVRIQISVRRKMQISRMQNMYHLQMKFLMQSVQLRLAM